MKKLAFRLLINPHLPFWIKRLSIIHSYVRGYIRHKKWELNSYNDIAISVVIPCTERDIEMLHFVVKNLRRFLMHPIYRIYIVSSEHPFLSDFCRKFNCIFIDENIVLPVGINDIREYIVKGIDRRGWLFQQLLKLGADSFVETPYYYVLDADTVLISPQHLLKNNKIILNISDEFHRPYRITYKRLLGEEALSPVSFVAHQMIFEKKKVAELKEKIEQHTGLHWYEAIINQIDRNESSSFSEYETYGNFLFKYYLHDVELEYFFNLSLDRILVEKFTELEHEYQGIYKSLSFHWYVSSKINVF